MTAAVSHTIGGGAPPHPLLVLALSVLLSPIAAVLVGSTLRIGNLVATVLVAQGIFHVLFIALGATLAPGISAGGHHHVMVLPSASPGLETMTPSDAMLAAHLVAALVTVAILWRGEQLLRGISRWVRAVLGPSIPRLYRDWPTPPSLETATGHFVFSIRTGELFLRGPPLFSRG